MAFTSKNAPNAIEIDRLALQLAKDPHSKVFLPLAEEYCKAGMWAEASVVLEDGLKYYPGFITAMVVLGRAYDQLGQATKAKAILEEAVKLSPENLRAYRTLVKIYVAQEQMEQALKCCDVILGVNPRDEEALSIRAKLGKPAAEPEKKPSAKKHKVPEAEPKPGTVSPPAEAAAEPVQAVSEPAQQGDTTPSPMSIASQILESSLEIAIRKLSAAETAGATTVSETEAPSPHAHTIERLEAWLRSIQRNRQDHAA